MVTSIVNNRNVQSTGYGLPFLYIFFQANQMARADVTLDDTDTRDRKEHPNCYRFSI